MAVTLEVGFLKLKLFQCYAFVCSTRFEAAGTRIRNRLLLFSIGFRST